MEDEMRLWHPEIETMERERLRALQGERLCEQVSYVYQRSAFYRGKFGEVGLEPGDIRGLEDIRKLPFVSKDELRRCQDESPPIGAHVCARPEEIAWLPSTSGTTGTPLLLPRTAGDIETWTELN